jgi:hypothetical protein
MSVSEPRGTILVAALAYTAPLRWSLFGPLREATTGATAPPGEAVEGPD